MTAQRRTDIALLAVVLLVGFLVMRHADAGWSAVMHQLASFVLRMGMALLALSAHEWAHGYAAWRLGDSTARDAGRLTLNPLAHFSLVGLLVVPGMLTLLGSPIALGWAKPVPVDFGKTGHPRRDMAIIAAAGPICSIGIAIAGSLLLTLMGITGSENLGFSVLWTFVVINFSLGLFNLLPLYPMDGGRILATIMPGRLFNWLRQHEPQAALASVGCLILLPWACQALGYQMPGLEGAEAAFLQAVAVLTQSPDAAWIGPLQAWMASPT